MFNLAEVLREHDFLTAGIVNSHWLSKTNGLDQGFEEFHYVKESANRIRPTKVEDEAKNWLSKRRDKRFFFFCITMMYIVTIIHCHTMRGSLSVLIME